MTITDGLLSGKINGPDPYLIRMLVNVAGDEYPVIRLRMRVTAGHSGQFFWTTEASPFQVLDNSVQVSWISQKSQRPHGRNCVHMLAS